jgi:hypothetical protein
MSEPGVKKVMVPKGTVLPPPWEPAMVTQAELHAIRALYQGQANEEQQRVFVDWLTKASGVLELEFRTNDRESNFAGGKRFVGLQFFSLAKTLPPQPR